MSDTREQRLKKRERALREKQEQEEKEAVSKKHKLEFDELVQAIQQNDEGEIRKILESSSYLLNMKDDNGRTPVMFTLTMGRSEAFKILTANEIFDPSENNGKSNQTLYYAAGVAAKKNVYMPLDIILRNSKSNPNQTFGSRYLNTVLIKAAAENNLPLAQYIMQNPLTDINFMNGNGHTALTYAAKTKSLDVLKFLLSHPKIDTNLVDNAGRDAYTYCTTFECQKLFHDFAKKQRVRNIRRTMMNSTSSSKTDFGVAVAKVPSDVWDLILKRELHAKLCDTLSEQNKKLLVEMALRKLYVPFQVAHEWYKTKSQPEICELVSNIISIGGMYSEKGMKFLEQRDKSRRSVGLINKFLSSLSDVGIETYTFDENGDKVDKSIKQLLQELAMLQRFE